MRNFYELLRTTRTAQSKKTKAERLKKLNQRRRSRLVQLEQLEPRHLMASSYGLLVSETYWDGCSNNYGSAIGSNCSTNSPVRITSDNALGTGRDFTVLKAPDGGRVVESANPGSPYFPANNTFYPHNGLLTFETGQTNQSFAVQQEIEVVPSNFFSTNVVQGRTDRDTITYQTSVKVTTSGEYTFYWSADTANNTGANSTLRVANNSVTLGPRDSQQQLKVTLTAGIESPVVIVFSRAGHIDRSFGLDWSGPGVTRQRFTPTTDVNWKYVYPDYTNQRSESGFLSVGATIDARKRLNDLNYALRYTTTFTVPTTGSYSFFVTTTVPPTIPDSVYNDAATLKLGSDVVVNKDKTAQSATGTRTLTAGSVVTLEVNYLHRHPFFPAENNLKVEWSGPGIARTEFKPTNPLKYEYFDGVFAQIADYANRTPTRVNTLYDSKVFALSWNGQTTPLLSVGASAEDVKNALTALSNIGAAGGSVAVVRSKDGNKYTVTFGGSIFYKPTMITGAGSDRLRVSPSTTVALTKREEKSKLKVVSTRSDSWSNRTTVAAELTNGNSFPISNAPLFTPTFVQGDSLRGNLEISTVAGVFEPASFNVRKSSDGLKLLGPSRFSDSFPYLLKAQTGANGIARPISFLKIGGLDFEAPASTRVGLEVEGVGDPDGFSLISKETSMLVSAVFEGGRLTLRLKGDGLNPADVSNANPIFSVSTRTGAIKVTSDFELVSFEIGGIVIPASDGFKMAYDRNADKFTFTINNLNVGSTLLTGSVNGSDPSILGSTYVQQFDVPGINAAGSTYESVMLPYTQARPSFQSIAEFESTPNKITGSLPFDNAFQYGAGLPLQDGDRNLPLGSFGTKYKATFTVPTTGTYSFRTSNDSNGNDPLRQPIQQLKINNTVVAKTDSYYTNPTVSPIDLTAGVTYSLEFTVLYPSGSSRSLQYNLIVAREVFNYRAWRNLNLGGGIGNSWIDSSAAGTKGFNTTPTEDFATSVRKAVFAMLDANVLLTEQQRSEIKSDTQVSFQSGKLTVTGLPFAIRVSSTMDPRNFKFQSDLTRWQSNSGTVANPVKFTMRSGTLTLTKGVLSPLSNIPVDTFAIGRTTVNQSLEFQTEFEPLQPSGGSAFKLSYFPRNTYAKDGAVNVPGNSFGIFGSETQLPLDVAGVKLNGAANLGIESNPGLVITNAQFNRLSYSIPDVTVDGLVFKATSVGSAMPLSVNYYPPQGIERKSYVVQGGAVLKAGGTIKSDMKANFGGSGSDGLRIFPANRNTPASFMFSFGVAGTFLAGTQAIQSVEGLNGLNLLYDQKAKAYNFRGNAFLDFNPTRPHTPTDLVFTGTKLAVTANIPNGVTNFPANRLDSNTLNFFFTADSSLNGFRFSPRPTSNPLRVTITNNNGVATDTVGGAFTMLLDGANLFGVMNSTSFTNATYPSTGYVLDFTPVAGLASGFALVGVTMDDAKKATLTKTLSLKFPVARFDGNVIAQGAVGSEVAILEAVEGKITKAEITSPSARVIGDFNFQNFKATYSNNSRSKIWTFVGPATYQGKQVNVGTPAPGNPQLRIGADPKLGFQLQTISKPVELLTPDFKLPSSIEVAGLNFDTALLPQDAPVVDQGPAGKVYSLRSQNYGVKLGNTTLSLSVGAKVRVSSSGVSVESFSATGVQNSAFTIGNASLQIKTLTVEYILATNRLQISGDAKFTFKAKAVNVEMNVTLGTKANPGLVIEDGAVESFQVTVTGTFELFKLSIAAEKLTVEYKRENQEFSIYGGIRLSTAAQGGVQVIKDLALTLGSKDKPGIKIVNGNLDSLDITINGEINLFKITATPKNLRISYTAAKNQLQITGELTITLAPKLELTAALPGEGLLIDTSTGKVQVRGLSLSAQGDIKFGAMTIKGLKVEYSEDDAGEVTIAAAAEIQLPSGLAVGGSFKIINGKLDSIGISFEKNPGIQVANGLVNIYRIEASVEGLTNLDNFKISGTVKASVGPLVKFGGESYALADVTGTINITPAYLELIGDVQLVGGKFGNGKFVGRLDWNPKPGSQSQSPQVVFEADVNLYPGDIVRGKIVAFADIRGNIDFTADMGVFVPQAVPLAGGISLGRLQVELRVRPAEEPSASYAKFGFSDIAVTAIRVPTFHGSVRIGFDKVVDYNFGARFYIPLPWPLPDINYSIDKSGKFQLRDTSDNPFVEILAAASVSGTPNAEIVFSSMTPLPDDTFIDIYADNDNLGNDGFLIASSIPYRAGSQTFVWEDMAAFASPGDPVYVYAVINDGKNAKGYSDYSPRFNVAPGFVPTITAPTVLNFAAGDVAEFSAAHGNAIVIGDPRNSHNSDSEVEVILNVGGGTVDLSHAPVNVRYSGEGTSRMTLRGSASAITESLDGLRYAQRFATDATDTLEITVNNLPLENLAGGVKKSILLDPNPLKLSLLPSQDSDAPNTITIGDSQETPLENINIASLQSSFVTGAKVAIVGYEKGQDLLSLPLDDEYFTDVDGSFDFDTGILTLSGFEWIEDYEYALQNVVFTTKSATAGKSLAVSLADDDGEKGQLVVPLTMVAGRAEPQLFLNSTGIPYIIGAGEKTLLPEGTIDIEDGSTISSITISFVEESYVAGEDLLSYTGTSISGVFDTINGVLTLSGSGTEEDWSGALQHVKYSSIGATFTEGNRYIDVTVTDNGVENNIASAIFVVDKALSDESHSSPVLTLTTNNLDLPANEEFAYLDTELTLMASSPMLLWATVAITGNYISGEDELAVTTTWDGINSEFDPLTGVLTISGLATVFEYEDMLRSVIFIDSAAYRTPGPAEITYTVFDGLSESETQLLTIEIAAAPYVESDLDRILFYDGGQTAEPINDAFSIQHSGQLTGATVSIAGGFVPDEDVLIFANGNAITGTYDAETGVLTLVGTASTGDYEAALATVQYKNTRFNPSFGDRIIDFQVLDGTTVSNVSQSLVVVDADVVPPQVSFAVAPSYTEDGSPVAIAPDFTLTSRDATVTFLSAQEVLYGAEISIVNYLEGEDLLTLVGSYANIEGQFDEIEGRIFLTGEATFDEYEAVIRSIVYSNSSDVPTTTPRQISIRLLDSGANGLNNQAITTQVIVGLPDPVTLVSGVADDALVMQNDASVSLGLEDLAFATQEISLDEHELVFTAINLPSELLGSILLSDGTRLQLNTPYSIAKLQGLRFEPQVGGLGVADFTYSVALSDLDSGNLDSGVFTDTIKITVDGVATTTSSQAFVAQVFRDLLGKNPDQATLTSLATQLDQKLKRVGREENGFFDEAVARQSLVSEFTNGDIYRRAQLNDYYQAIFGRAATTDEMTTLLAELTTGKTLEQVRFALLASDDYFRTQSSSGFASYVNAIYLQLLDREPTTMESSLWTKSLSNGQSRITFVTKVGNWLNVSTSDREAIVADLLHREPDFNDTLDFDFTSRLSLLQSVIASDEYYMRSSTPTNTNRVLTHATTDYPSVGKLGDIGGDKAGGTLIAPQFVLVAAHSVVGLPPGQLKFTVGGNSYRISDVHVHPDFDADALGTDFGNDIAILQLDKPVDGVDPSLLSGLSPRLGQMLRLVGFGEEGGSAYGTKRVGSTPSIDVVGTTTFRWTHTSEIQNDSDPGDSGSPLFVDVNGVSQVIGIVSGGTSNFDGVGDTATNTRIDQYLEWIRSIVPSVQVTDVADPPSIALHDSELYIDENAGLQTVPFEVAADDAVVLSVESDASDMFTELSLDFDGNNVGNLVFITAQNKRGTAKIRITAYAGSMSTTETMTVTIEERNDRPTLDPVSTQVIDVGTSPRTIALSGITAGIGETGNVRVAIVGTSPSGYFSNSGITHSPGSSTASIQYAPSSNATGRGTINLEIRDAGTDGIYNNADDSVVNQLVDVIPNNAPTLNALGNMRILRSSGEQVISLSGISSGETPAQALLINAVSNDPNVISTPAIVYDPESNPTIGQLKFTPLALGAAVITVTVRDAGPDGLVGSDDDNTTTRTFNVEVVEAINPWQNPTNPLDVDNDGNIGSNDVLVLVNAINRSENGVLPNRDSLIPPFYDVNGNDELDLLDVLTVINAINRLSNGGEGEQNEQMLADTQPHPWNMDMSIDSIDQLWTDTNWLEWNAKEDLIKQRNRTK